jgi:N-acetylmuramoyl-L-alanine amidase
MFDSNLHIKNWVTIFLVLFIGIILHPLQTEAQTREVIAQKGDGIYRLLTRHGLSVSDYINAFIELNKNQLGENNSLIAGVKYKLPDGAVVSETPANEGGTFSTYKIFGKEYEFSIIN